MVNRNFQNFLGMLSHPEGRDRATPTFGKNWSFLRGQLKLDIFSKFLFMT